MAVDIDNKELNNYNSNLKRIRVSRGMTQGDLSTLTGINIKSIASYEQDPKKINKASVEKVLKLCDCLNCNISDIIEKKYLNI